MTVFSPNVATTVFWQDSPWFQPALAAVDAKTKPVGALGQLEALAVQLACFQGTLTPVADRARVVVFAGDHGVADDGVSAYPKSVTAEMMRNFARGSAAICVLSRSVGADLEVIDVGVDADLSGLDGVVHASVRRGTRNMRHEPAMTRDEYEQALQVGKDAAHRAHAAGMQVMALGEMGIGNTTSAAVLTSALTHGEPNQTVGRGTGIDDARYAQKRAIVSDILSRHNTMAGDTAALLAATGGFEIVAMAGAAMQAAALGMVVLVDGYISTAAILAATRLDANVRAGCVFAHRSPEPGHAIALAALHASPLLALDMRLGEASGAALAIPLVRAAARMLTEMATFASAGVSVAEPA